MIGKTERVQTEKEVSPGPTKYDLTRYSFFVLSFLMQGKERSGFTIVSRKCRVISEGPGPGEYALKHSVTKFLESYLFPPIIIQCAAGVRSDRRV